MLLCGIGLFVSRSCRFDFTLADDGSGYVLTGWHGIARRVVLPETHKGRPVVRVGREAFRYSDLTSVTIPESVTTIGIAAAPTVPD